jgi:predicted unusual protein kinase regulating ubiquinone biosynthesis (AarF/ABC1/UbiB family)
MNANLPTGRLGRFAKLARLGASTGASLALSKDGKAAAALAADVLGELRGLAAKIGQMASCVDGMVPEGHRDAYEKALGALQASALTSPPGAIRTLVEAELGAPVETLFDTFDDEPFASASIGQVHRATFEGRTVAVKVQHPGIDRAIRSDLDNASMIKSFVGTLAPRALEIDSVFAEVRARFEEELDYEKEAASLGAFRAIHAGEPRIVIPAVVPERSKKRVLTTELVEGRKLEEIRGLPEADRRAYAETLWRFVFKGLLVHKLFNADPHPGNYVFLPDGRVAFLDFGCTQTIDIEHNRTARAMHRAALDGDERRFFEAVKAFLGTRGGPYEEKVTGSVRTMFTPLFQDTFRITPGFVSGIIDGMRDLKMLALSKKSGFVPMKPGMVFLNRLQFGFYSVLARLDVEVSYRGVEERILQDAGLRAG